MYISADIPANSRNKVLAYLETYLNEILKLDPPLKVDGVYDLKTDGEAVLRFKREYNLRFSQRKLAVNMMVDAQLWIAIGEMLGPDRLQQEIKTLKNPDVIKLLQGLPLIIPVAYTAEIRACDQKIANLFGGKGSEAAAFVDIAIQNNEFKGRITDRSDHLYKNGVFHLYTDEKGTDKEVGLFVPKGAIFVPPMRKTAGEVQDEQGNWNSEFTFRLDDKKYKGITVIFVHVGGTYGGKYGGAYLGKEFINAKNELIGKENDAKTSVQIGNIGGLGGKSGEGLLYRHCHIVAKKNGVRIDPRKVFC